MSMISCDMRYGRSDAQKRALSAGLLRVISEATGEPADKSSCRAMHSASGIAGFVLRHAHPRFS
jgi:hypothetical protein